MATKKQTNANHHNARRSTGPKTAAGKVISSMNALRHGMRAETIVLPFEDQADFDRIHAGLQAAYDPQNAAEQHLVDEAANARWKLLRAEIFEASSYRDHPSGHDHLAILGSATQIQSRLSRTYFRAYKELARIKAAREKLRQQAQQAAAQPPDPASAPASNAPPAQPPQSSQPTQSKPKTKKEERDAWKTYPKFELTLVDPKSGFTDVLFRSEYGKEVKHFSDEPPSPQPPVPPPSANPEPPVPPLSANPEPPGPPLSPGKK